MIPQQKYIVIYFILLYVCMYVLNVFVKETKHYLLFFILIKSIFEIFYFLFYYILINMLGGGELYKKLAKTIKVAQYEIKPIKLAKFAYLFSKASESMKAGYGTYHVAESRLTY